MELRLYFVMSVLVGQDVPWLVALEASRRERWVGCSPRRMMARISVNSNPAAKHGGQQFSGNFEFMDRGFFLFWEWGGGLSTLSYCPLPVRDLFWNDRGVAELELRALDSCAPAPVPIFHVYRAGVVLLERGDGGGNIPAK